MLPIQLCMKFYKFVVILTVSLGFFFFYFLFLFLFFGLVYGSEGWIIT